MNNNQKTQPVIPNVMALLRKAEAHPDMVRVAPMILGAVATGIENYKRNEAGAKTEEARLANALEAAAGLALSYAESLRK